MSYNRVILMGRLTAAPDMRSTSEGTEYCRFTVACDRKFAKKGEEKQADFISCTAWRQTAVFVNKYFSKGSMIQLEGEWRHERYDKDGETRYSDYCLVDSVSFCGSKNESGTVSDKPQTYSTSALDIKPDEGDFQEIDDDDSLPF